MLYVWGSALFATHPGELWRGAGSGAGSVVAVLVPPVFLQQGPVLFAHSEDGEPSGRGGRAPVAQAVLTIML